MNVRLEYTSTTNEHDHTNTSYLCIPTLQAAICIPHTITLTPDPSSTHTDTTRQDTHCAWHAHERTLLYSTPTPPQLDWRQRLSPHHQRQQCDGVAGAAAPASPQRRQNIRRRSASQVYTAGQHQHQHHHHQHRASKTRETLHDNAYSVHSRTVQCVERLYVNACAFGLVREFSVSLSSSCRTCSF